MGDPAGIGPELCAPLAGIAAVKDICTPFIFGDTRVISLAAGGQGELLTPKPLTVRDLETGSGFADFEYVDVPALVADWHNPGTVDAATGQASFNYVTAAIDAALAGHVDAVVTGPINKEAWQAAGITYPGHTELFAERAASEKFCMMMTSPAFSCSLVTTHVGYHEVPALLTTERITEVIELTHESLQRILGRNPRLAVLGLNPHAGERGLFGRGEEERILVPAIEAAREAGMEIEGPLPPDTAFLPWRREQTDGFICMYHDQGLIPFKALAFDTGVNITLGLPVIRTSVDHGTALDIAWQGKADASSLIAAVRLATKLAN